MAVAMLRGEFTTVEQDIHDINTPDSAMVSVVHFRVRSDDRWHDGTAIVKQIAGGSYQTDPLEVGSLNYEGPAMKYDGFRDLVERYYRAALDRLIQIAGGSGVRMRNNTIAISQPFETESAEQRAGW